MIKPTLGRRVAAAWFCLLGQRVLFNLDFEDVRFVIAKDEHRKTARLIHLNYPDDAAINGIPMREMGGGWVRLPEEEADC